MLVAWMEQIKYDVIAGYYFVDILAKLNTEIRKARETINLKMELARISVGLGP